MHEVIQKPILKVPVTIYSCVIVSHQHAYDQKEDCYVVKNDKTHGYNERQDYRQLGRLTPKILCEALCEISDYISYISL